MLVCVLQSSPELSAASTGTGPARVGGTSSTEGPGEVEACRWTISTARPSRWAALSSGPWRKQRVVKTRPS